MGVQDVEAQPLLATGIPALVHAEPVKVAPARRFKGSWFHVFGPSCDGHDVAACALAWKFPCLAFGLNSQRGLRMNFWVEAIKFVLLFAFVGLVLHVGCCLAMMVACGPPPMDGPAGPGMMHGMTGSGQMMDSGSMGPGKGMMEGGRMLRGDGLMGRPFEAADDRDAFALPRPFGDDGLEGPDFDAECVMAAAPGLVAVAALAVATFVMVTYWAARRREALRQRFGVEGSFANDFLLWTACAPCALAQETRTLMHNNVHGGLWHGELLGQQQVVVVAPQPQVVVTGQKA